MTSLCQISTSARRAHWMERALAFVLPTFLAVVVVTTPRPSRATPTAARQHTHKAASSRHPSRNASSSQTVTGSYDGPNNARLDVQELSGGRVKFDVIAFMGLSLPGGPRTGEASGVVALRRGMAVYRAGEGALVMRFLGRKVVVQQQGEMPNFGGDVSASGTYVRHSRKPRFNSSGD